MEHFLTFKRLFLPTPNAGHDWATVSRPCKTSACSDRTGLIQNYLEAEGRLSLIWATIRE